MKKLLITTGLIITAAALTFSASSVTVHAQEDCEELYEGFERSVCKAEARYFEATGEEVECGEKQTVGYVEGGSKRRDLLEAICKARLTVEQRKQPKATSRATYSKRRAEGTARFKKKSQQIRFDASERQEDAAKRVRNVYGAGPRYGFDRKNVENAGMALRGGARSRREMRAMAGTRGMERELKMRIDAFKTDPVKKEKIKLYKATADGADIMRIRNKIIACMADIKAVADAWACIIDALPLELR